MEDLKTENKEFEFCAIPKEFVLSKLSELEVKYKDLVAEYNFWKNVETSQVNIIESQDETTKTEADI